MQLLVLIGIIILISFWKNEKSKSNDTINSDIIDESLKSKNTLKKVLYGILLFFPLYIMYYFIIAMISGIIIAIFANAIDGSWAYALILGLSVSPILTIITIIKILDKKQ